MKRKRQDLKEHEFVETLDALYTAAGTVRGRAAMKLFLKDLLTPSERIMLGRRILIARSLICEEPALEIAERMKVGLCTIYRVERWLRDQFPGFENAVRGMEMEHVKRRKDKEYLEPFTFRWLKRKYPLHFLLFPPFK